MISRRFFWKHWHLGGLLQGRQIKERRNLALRGPALSLEGQKKEVKGQAWSVRVVAREGKRLCLGQWDPGRKGHTKESWEESQQKVP